MSIVDLQVAEEAPLSREGQSDTNAPGASVLSMAPVLLAEDDEVHACIVEASLANARLANPVVRARTGDEAAAYHAAERRASSERRSSP